MIEVTPLVAAGVGAAAFTIGFAKAGVGGSLGPLVTILAVLVLPVPAALGILLPLLIVGDVLALAALWRRWELRLVRRLLPGALIGVAGGTYLLSRVASPVLARLLGALTLLFVLYWLLEPRLLKHVRYVDRRWHGHAAGAVAGLTSALAHSGGPPVTVYLLLQRAAPVKFVASSAVVFAVLNATKIPGYMAAGLFDFDLQLQLAWAAILVPMGVVAGRFAITRVDTQLFHRLTVALLACTGTYLLVG